MPESSDIHLNHSRNVSPTFFCLVVWGWLNAKGRLLANVSNKENKYKISEKKR